MSKNDNERRGLPADIDLLIRAAKSVIRQHEGKLDPRIQHLSRVTDRVDKQYKTIFNVTQ